MTILHFCRRHVTSSPIIYEPSNLRCSGVCYLAYRATNKEGPEHTYCVCLSVCLSCLKPKNFGETKTFWWKIWLVENKIWRWCRGGSASGPLSEKLRVRSMTSLVFTAWMPGMFGPTFYVFYSKIDPIGWGIDRAQWVALQLQLEVTFFFKLTYHSWWLKHSRV